MNWVFNEVNFWWSGKCRGVDCKQGSVDSCCFECLFYVPWDSLCNDNAILVATENNVCIQHVF